MSKQPQRRPKALKFLKFRFTAMGSPCELQIYAPNEKQGKQLAHLVQADVLRLEQKYSRYRDDSLLSEVNRVAACGGTMAMDEETAGLLDYAATCHQQSDGLFDITSGVLRRAWRFERCELPEPALIDGLLVKVGWHKLLWSPPTLTFPTAGMEIDFGGVVKEYAADRAAVICQEAGIHHGLVNLGGDIRVIGPMPDGRPWIVGIQHPRIQGGVLKNLNLFHGGMASSGDYARCVVIDGQRYSHIINPKTGWPVKYMAAVSVVANFCLVAGSASTIGMLKEQAGGQWLGELGLPHIWVDNQGGIGGSL